MNCDSIALTCLFLHGKKMGDLLLILHLHSHGFMPGLHTVALFPTYKRSPAPD